MKRVLIYKMIISICCGVYVIEKTHNGSGWWAKDMSCSGCGKLLCLEETSEKK